MVGAAVAAKDLVFNKVETHVGDALDLITKQHQAVKEFVDKKIKDYITSVQAATALTQQVRGTRKVVWNYHSWSGLSWLLVGGAASTGAPL